MGFLQGLKYKLQAMMAGRNGIDSLSRTMVWIGIGLLVLAMLISSSILNGIALALYVVAIWRMFSRNTEKRSAENRAYLQKSAILRNKTKQLHGAVKHHRNRFKNRKQYRYFKCPDCKSWLRVPRGAGQVKVTCGNCKHQFSYIAK